ncbi:hypothetical protein AAFF_G00192450 [Aldrovandia affinis]|uniref:Uncharacterized protein n=1 Tax=Aldrovandia affinis TaxID=143900 RepID=A0AAD7RJ16_9TELE|nr:hypothetical protein AAFF_G00192450 [Aldrovandia affinis]
MPPIHVAYLDQNDSKPKFNRRGFSKRGNQMQSTSSACHYCGKNGHWVQCPVCLPQLLLDGTGGRNASVTCPSPDNIWETGWLFATIPKEHLIVDHPPLTLSLWMVLLYMGCLPHTDGRPETLMRSPSSPTFPRLVPLTKELLKSVEAARTRYHDYLTEERRKKKLEAKARKRKAAEDDLEELRKRKKTILEVSQGLAREADKTAEEAE